MNFVAEQLLEQLSTVSLHLFTCDVAAEQYNTQYYKDWKIEFTDNFIFIPFPYPYFSSFLYYYVTSTVRSRAASHEK